MNLSRFRLRRVRTSPEIESNPKRSRSNTTENRYEQDFRLLDLPDELLILAISDLDETSLRQLRAVSRHLKELCEPFVFRDLEVLKAASAHRLVESVNNDSRRATHMRSFLVSTSLSENDGLEHLPALLADMRNLRTLRLETPDCNQMAPEDRVSWINLQQGYEHVLARSTVAVPAEKRLLPNLQECTIHFVDEVTSLYSLTKYSSIFLHPTLKTLTLSCACTDFPDKLMADYQKTYKRSTALERLHLEECDICAPTLAILLRFPAALKSLKISEGIRYDEHFSNRNSRMHGNAPPQLLSEALAKSCKDSLEHLSLALGHQRRSHSINTPRHALDLTPLAKLKFLELSMSTVLLVTDRPCDHLTHKRLPPNLETFRVFSIPFLFPAITAVRHQPPLPFHSCLVKEKAKHGIPHLRHAIWSYEYQAPGGHGLFGLLTRGSSHEEVMHRIRLNKDHIIDKCNKDYVAYKDAGVRLQVDIDITPAGFIPPYLYPEGKPTHEKIWDSENAPLEALVLYDREMRQRRRARQRNDRPSRELSPSPEYESQTRPDVHAYGSDEEDDYDFTVVSSDDEGQPIVEMLQFSPQAQELMGLLMAPAHPVDEAGG